MKNLHKTDYDVDVTFFFQIKTGDDQKLIVTATTVSGIK